MITPTVIILLVLLFSDGTSHPVKATSGSLVVSGCGCRYGNSAQRFTALHFPSLHAEAAPHGGIFTLADTTPSGSFFSVCFRCPVVWSFSLVLRGTRTPTAVFEKRGIPDAHGFDISIGLSVLSGFLGCHKKIPVMTDIKKLLTRRSTVTTKIYKCQ